MTLPPLFSYHFPSYVKDCFNNEVNILWYHSEFTQSRYPPGQKSNYTLLFVIKSKLFVINNTNFFIHLIILSKRSLYTYMFACGCTNIKRKSIDL